MKHLENLNLSESRSDWNMKLLYPVQFNYLVLRVSNNIKSINAYQGANINETILKYS